ncbi:hypothetical protein B0J14DRAFT_673045 [Halenospora varia]|nr:hypothetical protein B0J14DRAFT_673045 [Halenospora varia]
MWVYTGRYEKLICEKPDLEESKFMVRIKLYAFAEKIVQPHLMDYTMTALITNYEKLGIVPSPKAMHKAYELTPPNSLLRKFMGVSLHYTTVYYNFDPESKEKILDEITKALVKNKELARDFVSNVNSTGRESASPIMVPNKCIFHVHKDNFDKSRDHCEYTGDVH